MQQSLLTTDHSGLVDLHFDIYYCCDFLDSKFVIWIERKKERDRLKGGESSLIRSEGGRKEMIIIIIIKL